MSAQQVRQDTVAWAKKHLSFRLGPLVIPGGLVLVVCAGLWQFALRDKVVPMIEAGELSVETAGKVVMLTNRVDHMSIECQQRNAILHAAVTSLTDSVAAYTESSSRIHEVNTVAIYELSAARAEAAHDRAMMRERMMANDAKQLAESKHIRELLEMIQKGL